MNELITIIKVGSITQDEYGNEIENKASIEIFASKRSVSQNEFYNASQQGLKPSIILTIYKAEYQEGITVIHNDIEYRVIKTYEIDEDLIELTCERKLNND